MRPTVLLALALLARPLAAQTVAPTTAPFQSRMGSWLRLETTTRRHTVRGSLVAIDGDTLVLQTSDESIPGEPQDVLDQVRVPSDALRRAFVRDGHEPRVRAAARDGLYGAVLGAAYVGAAYATAYLAARHHAHNHLIEDVGLQPRGYDDSYREDAYAAGRAAARDAVHYARFVVPGGVALGLVRPRWRWAELPLRGE